MYRSRQLALAASSAVGLAAATTYADEDDEARFILHRGALEHPEMLGVYANDSLSFGLFPHEDSLNIDVDAIDVGVWYLQIVVISGSLRSGFEISHRLFGSRLARFADFNGCEFDDGTLSVTVRSENETYTRRESRSSPSPITARAETIQTRATWANNIRAMRFKDVGPSARVLGRCLDARWSRCRRRLRLTTSTFFSPATRGNFSATFRRAGSRRMDF